MQILVLRIFDLETTLQIDTIPIPIVGNCDGMTYAGNDQLFVIDTWGRIYRVNLATGYKNMFVSSGLTAWTQDCVYDEVNNRLACNWICNQCSYPGHKP